MRLIITSLSLLTLLGACATQDIPVDDRQRPIISEGAIPTQTQPDQFSPIRPATISLNGQETWICTPAGAENVSQCVRRGESVEPLTDTANIPAQQTPVVAASENEDERIQSIIDAARGNS